MLNQINKNRNLGELLVVSFTLLLASSTVLFFRSASIGLRPIADDYCIAVFAESNIFQFFIGQFQSWSGDIFQILISYIFVGYPILNFSKGVGSAVSLGFTMFTVFLVVLYIVHKIFRFKHSVGTNVFVSLITLSGICTTWITYWWYWAFVSNNFQFFEAILYWQTVNGPYVMQTSVSLLFTFYIFNAKFSKTNAIICSVLSFLIGTSGYVLAFSFGLLFALESLINLKYLELEPLKKNFLKILSVCFIIIGILVSINSPGAENRKSHYASQPNLGLTFRIITESFYQWFDFLISPSSFYVIISGYILFWALSTLKGISKKSEISQYINRMIFLSMISFLLNKVSEIFTYLAFWHEISSRTFLYFGLLFIGGAMALKVRELNLKIYFPVASLIFGCTVLLTIYGVQQAEARIEDRKFQWELAPAPSYTGTSPQDREADWISSCWQKLYEKWRT